MAGLRERNALQPTTTSPDYNKNLPYLPHQPHGTYHPNAPQTAHNKKMSKGSYIPPSGSAVDGDTHYTALPNMPAYNTQEYAAYETAPESVASSETPSEKRRFRKLIKRRPVPTR